VVNFFVGDQSKLVRGAARILIAPNSQAKPAKLADVINLTTYAAQTGWIDLGFTINGIQINVNNTESAFDVDQVQGPIGSAPTGWEANVVTQLAETTLDHLIIAWEGAPKTIDTTTTPDEEETGFAGAPNYTERRGAVMFQRPDLTIVGFFFHRWVRAPQQGTLDFQKAGNAQTIPIQFNCLADATESDPRTQFFKVRAQVQT
jgi:hypothetical protein